METVPDVLKRYFILVDQLFVLWNGLAKRASKAVSTIEALSEQLQATSSVGCDMVINTRFPDLKDRVVFNVLMNLEQELASIITIVQEVGKATEKLHKLASLIDSQRDLHDLTVSAVPAGVILEVASDCRQYYQAQYLGLEIALKCLDFRDRQSIKDLRKSFVEDKDLKKNIQRCHIIGKYYVSALDSNTTSNSK